MGKTVVHDVQQGLASFGDWTRLNKICAQWPSIPDKSHLEELIHEFLKETSTETLKLSTCASCTEKVVDGNSTIIPDANLNLDPLM